MGPPTEFSSSNNWDAFYNPLDHRVWVYYFDTADPQRLMRTHVDLNTGQAGQDEIEVNNSVGATGSDNLAIRVHRHHTDRKTVLQGKSVSVRVDLGGRRIIKKKNQK